MNSAFEHGTEVQTELPSIVREHLLAAGWGTDDYPIDLLALSESEQRILQIASTGMSLQEVARQEGLGYQVARSRYNAAAGKMEAYEGLGTDVLLLGHLAQKVVVFNYLFGAAWVNDRSRVMNRELGAIVKNTQELDSLIGIKWRRIPQLAAFNADTLRERIEKYDSVLGSNWRNYPIILTNSPDVIDERVAAYDAWFGESWHVAPAILTNDPNTVIKSARALKAMGFTQENTPPGPYFGLLGTSVANKRKKAAFIRTTILGHQQVRVHEAKRPLPEIVRIRRAQTAAEKELEEREIAELSLFIRHMGATRLAFSTENIKKWADAHGYSARSRSKFEE